MTEESEPAAGQKQSLTTVCLVPPASRVGTCLLANDCISTEDPASKLLFFLGFPTSAHVRHTVPEVEGEGWSRCALERGSKENQPCGKRAQARGWGLGTWLSRPSACLARIRKGLLDSQYPC